MPGELDRQKFQNLCGSKKVERLEAAEVERQQAEEKARMEQIHMAAEQQQSRESACTPDNIQKPKAWWIPSFSAQEAIRLVQAIPSVGVGSNRIPVPIARFLAPGKMISFGTVTSWNLASNANSGAELRTNGFGAGTINSADKPSGSIGVNLDTGEVSASVRFPSGFRIKQDGFSGSLGYSTSVRAKWDGWNTTASVDLNYADVNASGAGVKGSARSGVYVEVKPLQAAAVVAGVSLLIVAAVALGPEIAVTLGALGESGSQLLPQLLR